MNRFLKAQMDGMAKHGLLVETFNGYEKYTVSEIHILADFAEDPDLRKKSAMILDAIWAKWAVASINGIRGGGKTRRFGANVGVGETWHEMSRYFFDVGPLITNRLAPNPAATYPYIFATTGYRVPEVIQDIAKDHAGRGEYAYIGKRRARIQPTPQEEVPFGCRGSWCNFDLVDTRALSYDHCTPDYVMGSLLIDPTLGVSGADVHRFFEDVTEGYAPIFAQSMQMFTIFPTSIDALVCPVFGNQRKAVPLVPHGSAREHHGRAEPPQGLEVGSQPPDGSFQQRNERAYR